MKLKQKKNSIQAVTSDLQRPKPPTAEAIAKAQFVDKTYVWQNTTTTAKPS